MLSLQQRHRQERLGVPNQWKLDFEFTTLHVSVAYMFLKPEKLKQQPR